MARISAIAVCVHRVWLRSEPRRQPGDDFFAYANGTWIANTPIPADKPAHGSYIVQEEVTNQRIRQILEAAKADPSSKIGRVKVW
jgi:predicted metalloendopeptidase